MGRSVTVLCALTLLAAFPASVSAQADEDGTTSKASAQEPVSEPAPEEPAAHVKSTPATEYRKAQIRLRAFTRDPSHTLDHKGRR